MGFYTGNKSPADGVPNPPTTPDMRGFLMVFNGTTWDRVRSGAPQGSLLVANPVGSAGGLNATVFQGTSPWVVSGSVSVTGEVEIKNDSGNPIPVTGSLSIAGTQVPGDAVANPTDCLDSRVFGELFNGTTWDRARSGSPTADPGNVGVQATQLIISDGTNLRKVTSGQGDAVGSALMVPITLFGFNGTTFDRIREGADSASGEAPVGQGALLSKARNYGFNPTGGVWDRLNAGGDSASGEAPVGLGALLSKARNYGFNPTGGVWDRINAGGDSANGEAVVGLGALLSKARNYLFNGTTWDRSASAPGVVGAASVGGPTASGSALAVAPVTVGGRASQATPTAVGADGQVVNNWSTRNGRQRVYPSGRRRTGLYMASLGASAVTAAADAATAGRFWLVNNTGSTVFGALRAIYFSVTTTTGLLEITAPVFTVERMTFTGTPSGATITPGKRDSSDAANTLTVRTANTGMTITAGAAMHGFQVPSALATTSAVAVAQIFPYNMDEDTWIILRAGEGIVIRQSTAGTTLDTRIANFDIIWEEFNSTDFVVND